LFGISRQSYYKHKSNRIRRNDDLVKVRDIVMRIRCKMPRIGTRKLYYLIKPELDDLNIKIGRDVLFNFLRAEQLLIKPKRSYVKTTNSKHWMKKYPNLIKDIIVTGPEQLWVSDITYIKTDVGHEYLSLITDAYSKKIMGYELLDNLSTAGPLKALELALKNKKYKHELIHHSDRGLQYCSADYVEKLKTNNIKISMTENGDPYENAIAERINGILKYEFLIIDGFSDHLQALEVINESISIYNESRPHLSCQMLTPNKTHLQQNIQVKKWKKKTSKVFSPEVFF
jgi:putative transposase